MNFVVLLSVLGSCAATASTIDETISEFGRSNVVLFEEFVQKSTVAKLCNDPAQDYDAAYFKSTRCNYFPLAVWARMPDREYMRYAKSIVDKVHAFMLRDPRCRELLPVAIHRFATARDTKPYLFYKFELEKVLRLTPEEEDREQRLDEECTIL